MGGRAKECLDKVHSAEIIPFPDWKKIYNMFILDEFGTIITTTVVKPISCIPDLVGMNIQVFLKRNEYQEYIRKIKQAINSGISQIHQYIITKQRFVVVIQKKDEHTVIIHEAKIIDNETERTKRLLLASSGWLFEKYDKEHTG